MGMMRKLLFLFMAIVPVILLLLGIAWIGWSLFCRSSAYYADLVSLLQGGK